MIRLFFPVTIVLCKLQLKNWENLPSNKPVFSIYSRVFGQEWIFADFKKDIIQNFVKVREPLENTTINNQFGVCQIPYACVLLYSCDPACRQSVLLQGKELLCGN